ncbi:MAG: hypothetical protein RLZZ292_1390 [Bacteroidota bacterium]|jgi:hypothetical protein
MLSTIFQKILVGLLILTCLSAFSALSAYRYFFAVNIDDPAFVESDLTSDTLSIDSLRARFGQNKKIPTAVEKECLVALSHFPEFAQTRIDFEYAPISFTMESQPKLSFLFLPKSKRQYKILINSDPRSTNLDYQELSFNGKIGWIGHELGHIYDYERMSTVQIIGLGISYYEDSFRRVVEHRTDQNAIQHGLGDALAEGVSFLMERGNARYLSVQDDYYMSVQEIKISSRLRSWVARQHQKAKKRRKNRMERFGP